MFQGCSEDWLPGFVEWENGVHKREKRRLASKGIITLTPRQLKFLSHIYDNIYSQAGHIEGAVACYGRYKHPPSSLGPGPSLPLRTHNQVFFLHF